MSENKRLACILMWAALGAGCGSGCPTGTEARGDRCVAIAADGGARDGGASDGEAPPDGGCPAECCGDEDCPGRCVEGACVDCTGDGDCEGVCVSGACVDCRVNGDCDEGVCDANRCVECRVDTDCLAGAPKCADNACVSCAGRDDCTSAQIAAEVRDVYCRCVGGLSFLSPREVEVLEATYCHPTGASGQASRGLAELTTAIDAGRVRVDLDALRAAHCPPDFSVRFLWGLVENGGSCFNSGECAHGDCSEGCPGTCSRGIGASCEDDFGCAWDLACDRSTGQCGPLPGLDAPCERRCAEGLYCDSSSRCRARPTEGMGCSATVPCADGLHCASGTCAPRQEAGADCTSDGQCRSGLYCEGTCRERPGDTEPCARGFLCAAGHVCTEGTCARLKSAGEACTRYVGECEIHLRCHGGQCRASAYLGEACSAGAPPCARGLVCRDGTCVGAPDIGAVCRSGETCLRGTCNAGFCQAAALGATCVSDYASGVTDALDPCGDTASCYGGQCAPDPPIGSACNGQDSCGPELECAGTSCAAPCAP